MQQTIKPRSARLLIIPTPEEEAQINAGIAAEARSRMNRVAAVAIPSGT